MNIQSVIAGLNPSRDLTSRRSGNPTGWLPGLDGLRALAALSVMIAHIEQARYVFGLPSNWINYAVMRLGGQGVTLFFVLSGFLITHLLLQEQSASGAISIPRFYTRRILRIWPLYFLIMALGFVILPLFPAYKIPTFPEIDGGYYWQKFFFYLFFSPHVATAILPGVPYAGVLWSVGVEEWFYLFWPGLMISARGRLAPFLLAIVAGLILARSQVQTKWLVDLLGELRFDCMAVGALGALACASRRFNPVRVLWPLFSWPAQIYGFYYIGRCLWTGWPFGAFDELVYSLMFLWLIVNLSVNPRPIVNFDNPLQKWLGQISYGLYCYNWITIVTTILLFRAVEIEPREGMANWVFHGAAVLVTIAVAAASYYLIERPFLRIKNLKFGVGPHKNDASRDPGAELATSAMAVQND